MTLDEGIEKAQNLIDKSLIPARSTISGWVRVGAITKPHKRENSGRGGGMRDIYPDYLPIEIATVAYLQKKKELPLKKIVNSKQLIESIYNNTFTQPYGEFPWEIENGMDNLAFNLWVTNYAKASKGIKFEESAEVHITIKYNLAEEHYSIDTDVKKAPKNSLRLEYLEYEMIKDFKACRVKKFDKARTYKIKLWKTTKTKYDNFW